GFVTDPDAQPADPDARPPADPDGIAEIGQAAAAEVEPTGVPAEPATRATPTEESAEAATRATPTEESAEAATPGQLPLGDSLLAQVARLDELDELPVAAHIERYEGVHNELHAALRGIHDPGG